MGNKMGSPAKVMTVTGELFKFKIPAKVLDVIKDYPDHVLLDSADFIRFHLRAKPLDPFQQLKPNRVYLLVHLPKLPLLRSQSGAHHRNLQLVKVNRRSVSDLSMLTKSTTGINHDDDVSPGWSRVKIRLPKVVMDRVMEESKDEDEIAERIHQLYLQNSATESGVGGIAADGGSIAGEGSEDEMEGATRRSCFNVSALCSPRRLGQRKYRRLMSVT